MVPWDGAGRAGTVRVIGMKSPWMLLGVALSLGCLEPNPDVLPRPVDMNLTSLGDLATQDMLGCPPSSYDAGAGKNLPEVRVEGGMGQVGGTGTYPVATFYLDVYEVTVAAYRDCVRSGTCKVPRSMAENGRCNWTGCPGARENHPINCINVQQAKDFCTWAGRRLPTEVEWQFAAGGPAGAASKYPWGNEEPVTGAGAQLCWYRSDSTCEVGKFPLTLKGSRSSDGVADLAGGVGEWTNTEYASTYNQPEDPCDSINSASCSVRGESWSRVGSGYFQTFSRGSKAPTNVDEYTGARCARTP